MKFTLGEWMGLVLPRGGRNFFFSRHRWRNLPEVLRDSPYPPLPLHKTRFTILVEIQIRGVNIQTCGAKIQIFSLFKRNKFLYHKNLPLYTRKPPGAADLSPTPPLISKELPTPRVIFFPSQIPNLITGISRWCASDESRRTQEIVQTVADRSFWE